MKKFVLTFLTALTLIAPTFASATITWSKDTGGTLNTGLIAAYNLENTTDDAGGFTLTNHGTTAFSAGKNNNAADGGASNTTKYLDVASNLGITGGNASFSTWVNLTTDVADGGTILLFQQDDATNDVSYKVQYERAGSVHTIRWRRSQDATANADVTETFTLVTGTYYNLVLRYDGTNVEGLRNGVSKGTAAGSGNGSGGTSAFSILADITGARNVSGLMDATYVWNKKLSDTEVADLYNTSTGSFETFTASTAKPDDGFYIFNSIPSEVRYARLLHSANALYPTPYTHNL